VVAGRRVGGGQEEAEAPLVTQPGGEAEAPGYERDREERGTGRRAHPGGGRGGARRAQAEAGTDGHVSVRLELGGRWVRLPVGVGKVGWNLRCAFFSPSKPTVLLCFFF
jgi:hypothetical protein